MKHVTEKLSNLFDIIIKAVAGLIFSICFLLCSGVVIAGVHNVLTGNNNIAATENQHASAAENKPAAIECGSCGAHVYEYWYVENINDGTPVEVCRYCYENYVANTATEN